MQKLFILLLLLVLFGTNCKTQTDNKQMIRIPYYEKEWDFYFGQVDHKIASLYLDLGLKKIAPIKGLNYLGYIIVDMNNPRPDGFSSQEESQTLYNIEDSLVHQLTISNNAIYAGRNTSDSRRDFYFFVADNNQFEKQIPEIMVSYPNYNYDFGTKEDQGWDTYFNFLYPQPIQMQSIQNRRVVINIEKNGDPLLKERKVDHWLYFQSKLDRDKYVEQIIKDNFKIEDKQFNDKWGKHPFQLRISRIDKVDYQSIDNVTIPLWQLAKEFNGYYDGWETSVEK